MMIIPELHIDTAGDYVGNYDDLTAEDVYNLVLHPYTTASVVCMRKVSDEQLDQIPIFRILEAYLEILQRDKQIKLTGLGALPRKVVIELYDKRWLLDDYIESGMWKISREQDVISIQSMRFVAEMAGLVKKVHGRLSLTQKATKLMVTNNRFQLFSIFFETFTEKFVWACNDGYENQTLGQFGWMFSIYLLLKLGGEPLSTSIYAQKYFRAIAELMGPQDGYRCYCTRIVDRFLVWFGFVTRSGRLPQEMPCGSCDITRTDIVEQLFVIEK